MMDDAAAGKKRLLVTGASGFLGWNLCRKARREWAVFGTFLSHPLHAPDMTCIRIDLTNFEEIRGLINRIRPHAVVHTAAISDVNFCQENRHYSHRVNVGASTNIVGVCSDLGIPCVFTSSDLVFDGMSPPYSEEDEPSPVNEYGEQKVLAEVGMRDRYPGTVICRMPLMFGIPGPVGQSFVQPLVRAMKTGVEVNLFIDEFRTPVSGEVAAEGMLIALERLPGMIHLGGPERISRYGFGRLLAEVLHVPGAKLNPCRQKDIPMSAPRPPDVSLDSSKANYMGFRPYSLRRELERLRNADLCF